MPALLPDASLLLTVPETAWRSLAARLGAIGFEAECARMKEGDVPPFEAAARPLRLWKARRASDLASLAFRCFADADAITEAEATRVLEGVDAALFADAGLLARTPDGGVVSAYEIAPFEGMLFLGDPLDRGGDAVMNWGQMTVELLRAAWTPEGAPKIGAALDLGCGAGTCALVLAQGAARAIGCDVSERAIVLSRANARLNGVVNVEFRQGDLCAPVDGDRFDLVVSQPPFIPRHDEAEPATYLWGGSRGDEIPLRALAEGSARLAPGGRGLYFIQWAVFDDEPIQERVREVVPDEHVDVLVLEARGQDVDGSAIGEASTRHPDLGPDYARALARCRDHYERMRIRDFRHTLVVLRRREDGRAWTSTARVEPFREGRVHGGHVDALLRASDLAARGKNALGDARVRLPKGTGFVREEDEVRVVFPAGSLLGEARVASDTHALLAALHEASTVREAARRLAQQRRAPVDAVLEAVVTATASLLRAGIVHPAK